MNDALAVPGPLVIGEREFQAIRAWIYERAGIHLSQQKKALVSGRLASRLRHYRLQDYGAYFDLIRDGTRADEVQLAVDLLTTNETHFFREPRHFDFLREQVLPHHPAGRPLRVWSAACSSGEEPYTIGMVLADALGDAPWEVLATDLSQRMLARARGATYPLARARGIPRAQLLAHCLKGIGSDAGTFRVAGHVTSRVRFGQLNLNAPLPKGLGEFDVIFLRNVMIYFDMPTKQGVVDRLSRCLRPGGHLLVGHSESLGNLRTELTSLGPAIYRKA